MLDVLRSICVQFGGIDSDTFVLVFVRVWAWSPNTEGMSPWFGILLTLCHIIISFNFHCGSLIYKNLSGY